MRKVMNRFLVLVAISITSLSGCGRSNAVTEAAKLMNAMITQLTIGQQSKDTLAPGELREVDCGKDAYTITTGEISGGGFANPDGTATVTMTVNFNVFLSGTTANDNPTLTCIFHAK